MVWNYLSVFWRWTRDQSEKCPPVARLSAWMEASFPSCTASKERMRMSTWGKFAQIQNHIWSFANTTNTANNMPAVWVWTAVEVLWWKGFTICSWRWCRENNIFLSFLFFLSFHLQLSTKALQFNLPPKLNLWSNFIILRKNMIHILNKTYTITSGINIETWLYSIRETAMDKNTQLANTLHFFFMIILELPFLRNSIWNPTQ